jgi:hypothetical protein
MLPIDDAEVRWVLIKYLAGLIDAGHIEPLIQGGLSPELLDALRNRRMRDITRIAQDPSIGFYVKVDSQRLITAFLRLDAVVRDKELLEYFVTHGAPAKLLTRFFRASGQELRAMRSMLSSAAMERGGRPNMPDLSVREHIHATWSALQASVTDPSQRKAERERLYALSQRFPDYLIGPLWTVVNEFGDTEPPVPNDLGIPSR